MKPGYTAGTFSLPTRLYTAVAALAGKNKAVPCHPKSITAIVEIAVSQYMERQAAPAKPLCQPPHGETK
jgi:hypothetical protein